MRESEIIALFLSDSADVGQPLDDCARLDSGTIVTTDALVESTHFRLDWSGPEDLAIKLWNVNKSDIAASGGEPDWCLLNLGLPAHLDDDWLRIFAQVLRTQLKQDNARLLGGDTFRSPHLVLSLTLAGRLTDNPIQSGGRPRQLTRDGSRPGDAIYVTGCPGLSLLGYQILSGLRPEIKATGPSQALHAAAIERHLRPRARLEWARLLRVNPSVHCMLDLSDGLYADLIRLAAANPMLIYEIDWHRLPVPDGPTADLTDEQLRELALSSGEELELLFAAPPGLRLEFPCTEIGRVIDAVEPEMAQSAAALHRAESEPERKDLPGTNEQPARRVLLNGAPWGEPPQWFQHF